MTIEQYRQSVSEAKAAAILKAARDQFLMHGYARTAVADIARVADVSTATLYKHHASKEDLFAAVLSAAADSAGGEFSTQPPGTTLVSILRNACWQYIDMQYTNHMNELLRVLISEASTHAEITRRMFHEVVDRRRDRVAGLLARMVEMGHLKPHDTNLSATFLGGMMKEIFVWPTFFDPARPYPAGPEAEAAIAEIVDIFLTGYGA
mgnify:CR=1 FL=1